MGSFGDGGQLVSLSLPGEVGPTQSVSEPSAFRFLLRHHQTLFLFLQIEILRFFDSDTDEVDFSSFERTRRLVFLAYRIAAVITDTQAIAGQGEFARLCPHRTLG